MPNPNQTIIGDALSKEFHVRAKKMISEYMPDLHMPPDRNGIEISKEEMNETFALQKQWLADHGIDALPQNGLLAVTSGEIETPMTIDDLQEIKENIDNETYDKPLKRDGPNFNLQVKVWIGQTAPEGQFINKHMQEATMRKVMNFILDRTPIKNWRTITFEEKVERFLKKKWMTIYIDYYINGKPYREEFRNPKSKIRLPDDYDMRADAAQIVDGKLRMIPETVKIDETNKA